MLLRKDKYTPQAGRAGSWETECGRRENERWSAIAPLRHVNTIRASVTTSHPLLKNQSLLSRNASSKPRTI